MVWWMIVNFSREQDIHVPLDRFTWNSFWRANTLCYQYIWSEILDIWMFGFWDELEINFHRKLSLCLSRRQDFHENVIVVLAIGSFCCIERSFLPSVLCEWWDYSLNFSRTVSSQRSERIHYSTSMLVVSLIVESRSHSEYPIQHNAPHSWTFIPFSPPQSTARMEMNSNTWICKNKGHVQWILIIDLLKKKDDNFCLDMKISFILVAILKEQFMINDFGFLSSTLFSVIVVADVMFWVI